jgi:hypothetical protein
MSEPSPITHDAEKLQRFVRLMADYTNTVLWDHDGAPLDPAKLPLSPRLRARLDRWRKRFQASFEREINFEVFAIEGRAIAWAMKSELPDWSIIYFDEAAAARGGYRGSLTRYEEEIE